MERSVERTRIAIVGQVLRSRAGCVVALLLAAAQLFLPRLGLPALPCLLREKTGIPCAGCGLSRSVAATFAGRLGEALAYHAYGPLVALALVLCLVGAILPGAQRLALAAWTDRFERRTGLTALLLAGLFLYWAGRFLYGGSQYVRLMAG